MKKTIHLLTAGCISALLISGQAFAQDTRNQDAVATAPTANAHSLVSASNGSSTNTAVASAASGHALKDFKGRFKDGRDEQWYPMKTGFEVCFKQDGYVNRAFYDKKGRWLGALTFCNEDGLPRDIRHIVKVSYIDLAITLVEIVGIPDHKVYLVHLEDKNKIIIVRVSEEGEMDIQTELSKPS
jgi:hypothetical protein